MAEQTGWSVHTLRYYEKVGLIDPVDRDANGYRLYSDRDLAWIEFLHRLRETGMPIRRMQEVAALRRQGDRTITERRQLLEAHYQEIHQTIQALQQNAAVIDRKIKWYKEQEEKHE